MHIWTTTQSILTQINNALLDNLDLFVNVLPHIFQRISLQLRFLVQHLNQLNILFDCVFKPRHAIVALLDVLLIRLERVS